MVYCLLTIAMQKCSNLSFDIVQLLLYRPFAFDESLHCTVHLCDQILYVWLLLYPWKESSKVEHPAALFII